MVLKDTIDLMLSEDYKKRFKAEYYQLKIRRDKLAKTCEDFMEYKLTFTPACDMHILFAQVAIMDSYIALLEHRAKCEHIDLD